MSRITRKRPVVTLVVLAGLLAAAAPANAGIAIGNPPTQQGGAVVAPSDHARLQSVDHEI
jgi:hypothetical protein